MSNYTKTTNFAAKDSLPSGNAAKIVKGAEIDTEFNNIATASATKANANNAALTGTTVFETLSDGTIGVTGWVDEDNMSSDSAVLIPTQQSVKAYVDSQVTAQDLDVTDGSNSIDIDLDSESLGILGGTGIDSTASGTGVTLAIDSTVTTLTGTQTLSNKTLTTPVISGALTTNSTIDGRDVATDGTKLDGIESGATADQTAAEIKTAYESNANTNAFTDADESKLDGIEASADVTDTTNVTAAGALMDSELTNITAVKALNQGVATGDSPTFAAVNAPLTGNVTGNLTGNVTGNVTGDLTGDVTGNVAGNLTGSVLTAAQTNITSVGILGALTVAGDVAIVDNAQAQTGFNIDVSAHRVSIWTANPTVSLDMGDVTDSIRLPVGTTAQRPTGAAGMFRYNSNLEQFEGYTSEWGSIGGGGGTNTFTTDSFTGNGSTTAYALSQVTSSEDNLLVFIEGVFQQQDAYSIATASGTTTLTFSAAPANGNAILIYSVASAVSGSNLNIDSMTGDGSDTTLTLTIAPVNENNTQVFIDGVYQSKSNYSISGTTLTFSTAPPTGTAVEVMTFTQTDINVPVDGTVTPAKIASGDFYFDTNTLYVDATNNRVGIGTSSPLTLSGNAAPGLTVSSNGPFILLQDANNADKVRYISNNTGELQFGIVGDDGATGKTEHMRIDASGRLGLGITPSATTAFTVFQNKYLSLYGFDAGQSHIVTNTYYPVDNGVFKRQASGYAQKLTMSNGSYIFNTAASGAADSDITFTPAMTLDASGNLLVGTTTSRGRITANTVDGVAAIGTTVASAINYNAVSFHNNAGTQVGRILANNAGTTQYITSSDARLKDNIANATDAGELIDTIQVRQFDWKSDGSHQAYGMIAQELQIVAPDAVAGDPDSEEVMGVDYSKLVPMLVKEIQSLRSRVAQLENN